MKFDYKHLAYHALVALYFIWLLIFLVLIVTSLLNLSSPATKSIFATLIIMNAVMGTALYIVIRLFKNTSLLNKIIGWSYLAVFIMSTATLALLKLSI